MSDDQTEEPVIIHYGILRKSGRYPWGSGGNAYERSTTFLGMVDELKSKGLSAPDIAKALGLESTSQLRTNKTVARNQIQASNQAQAQRMKDHGVSNVEIGKRLGMPESSVRALLAPGQKDRIDVLETTANQLRDAVGPGKHVDIGAGTNLYMGISPEKLNAAVSILKEEGYVVHNVQIDQIAGKGKTTTKVLAAPGTTYRDIVMDQSKIGTMATFSEDGGRSYIRIQPPLSLDSKRVEVRYGDEGGSDMDGVIQVRRGVDDVSLGGSTYAQVRVAVDGTHYLKGMAMYTDDLPAGVDVRFNTNKTRSAMEEAASSGKAPNAKIAAMKAMQKDDNGEIDQQNPFGSAIRRQITEPDAKGNPIVKSAMNIVNEEGDWDDWGKSLSSQMLSKQTPRLAKQQLDKTYQSKKDEYDEIMSLTNPVVKKKLLESFADDADSSAVHLKAESLPRQRTQAILPINSLKETEVYAPNFKDGESVVLIRFPHGGTFEIPELTVNNRNSEGKKLLGNALDAIGIHSKVAGRLSGADFDGDTVLVIPNNNKQVKTSSPLLGLKDFDPQKAYPGYDGMPVMKNKQQEMGKISNLITDMTIQGAPHTEIVRAVRHSMVVIDAEKHKLNYKESEKANGIAQLREKYQKQVDPETGKTKSGGAATLISRASSQQRVPDRKLRSAAKGGPIDPETGKKVYEESGAGYTKVTTNPRTGKTTTKWVGKTNLSTKLAETDDAHILISDANTVMENLYADHSNRLKALANSARKASLSTGKIETSDSAKKVYADQVNSLDQKLTRALRNAPLERQAQIIANTTVKAKLQANSNLDSDQIKKIKNQALADARTRTGANKALVDIEPDEWEAIQAGAISTNKLNQILNNADLDKVKALATPREGTVMTDAKLDRAKAMLANGLTQAEIASALGVPVSTVNSALLRKG